MDNDPKVIHEMLHQARTIAVVVLILLASSGSTASVLIAPTTGAITKIVMRSAALRPCRSA